ncbi:SDR family oxidoreductase [Sinomonas sp. ASV486]|uniref:SDR family oxidoreductase n=1 Tax=Sinomonas puerhi TaxID=3238584 RepID=A0AB39L7Q9_9MICC|nr:SDR family oxidoreductase [Sinomonas sp. ASV486]MDQ4492293.1 SDR family oxidoreductase [Sinomonas sp. ASV486]
MLVTGEDTELATRIGAVLEHAGAVVQRIHSTPTHEPSGMSEADAAVRELGGLDVLVNIGPASLPGDNPDPDRRSPEVERALEWSMERLLTTTEAALAAMTAGASIINVVSLSVRTLTSAHLALAAAVVDTTQDLAAFLAERGIRANVVLGGPSLEPAVEAALHTHDDGDSAAGAAQFDALVYLASESSRYVSGSVISVTRTADSPGPCPAEGVA